MKHLKNKTVWITGASSGIGEALAYAFAKQGAKLILTARNVGRLEEVQNKCLQHTDFCKVHAADLSNADLAQEFAQRVVKQEGKIDILINNAGRSTRSLAKETPLENDRQIMELNYFSPIALTKAVLPGMIAEQNGHIVAISSIVGKFGFPLRSSYSASKHAIQGYFESLRAELANDQVKVSIILPGRIQTDVSKNALTSSGQAHGKLDDGQANGMDAATCAHQIIKAIKADKREVLVGRKELLMVYIHKFFPFLYRRIVTKIKHT